MTRGILAFGAYIPRTRLLRQAMVQTNSWFNAGLKSQGKGARATCNWDEDAITMAVEAARDALAGRERSAITGIRLASTTFPFTDRLNAGIVAEALGLGEDVAAGDAASTNRAGTGALLDALQAGRQTLVVAAEKRLGRAASTAEMTSGDGAAALVVGDGNPVARLLASGTRTVDFVDHYRTPEMPFDYQWEERWIRDAGHMKIVVPLIRETIEAAGLAAGDISAFCMASVQARTAAVIAKAAGIRENAVADTLHESCGDTGVAHAPILLAAALERAAPGDRIAVVGFGQGADVLIFEVTNAITDQPERLGVAGHLALGRESTNYARYLAFNDLMTVERGMRAETDKLTPLSSLWRNRKLVTGFKGGLCTACGTKQIPRTNICVNPACNAVGTQEEHPFAEKTGRINSYTADRLTYSPDPPACFGMIQFSGGGRMMLDFTDVDASSLAVGQTMRMMFRIKNIDTQRGFRRYFWKAAPVAGANGGA